MKNLIAVLIVVQLAALAAARESYDVVVVGGSTAGIAAAEAAAKEGSSVCLIEPKAHFGGDLAGKLWLDAPFRWWEFPPTDRLETLLARAANQAPGEPAVMTPLRVKQICDRKLLDAGVRFSTWTYVTRVVTDDRGAFCGICTASRGGTREIAAKTLIDATEFGRLAERAGTKFSAFPQGTAAFTRGIVLGSPAKLVRKPFACAVTDDFYSARGLAAAEQAARDATWDPATLDAADTLLMLTNRTVVSVPANVRAVGLIDERMNLSDFIAAGRAAGVAMARLAKQRPSLDELAWRNAVNAKGHESAEVACDVLVVGAGTAGAPAAIAAARKGLKVIVCDPLYRMGGVMTDGLIDSYCYGLRIGFTPEIDKGVAALKASVRGVGKAEWFRREARAAGAEVWFGAMAVGARPGTAPVVEVAFADGTVLAVNAKAVIDATGNADIAAMLGEETEFIDASELSLQGAGSTAKVLGRTYLNTDCGFVDDTDAEDLMNFALRARLSMGDYAWDQSQVVNSRERRRLHGVAYVTPQDVILNRTYPDVIARTYSNFDTHGQTVGAQFFVQAPHAEQPIAVNLPYRCLLPKKTDGLLVTGLGMSAHRDAMPILRMQPDVQNQGYAAGLAAAMAVRTGKRLRDVDVKALQKELIAKGIVDESVLTMKDSLPLSDAKLADAARRLDGTYAGLAELLSDPSRAKALLLGRTDLPAAHVLALMGDASAAATLIRAVETNRWDAGWNYRGMDQFGRSVSWVDSYLIALGKAKAKAAVPALVAKMGELTAADHYSHFRAVALCAESLGDKAAVDPLRRLLALKGVGGKAMQPFADGGVVPYPEYAHWQGGNRGIADRERSDCLRELCLARALYNLGDSPDKLGERTLREYAEDPRRAYANHAKKVLKD